jgi:ubiquinone/menaquinone biosynthesis C-methylase UbiE
MRSILLTILIAGALPAQVAEKANEGYRTPEGRSRVANTLAASDRDARQRPKELIEAMGVKPGMTVADVGTGVGYMLPFLSTAVGPTGKVIAQDIFPDFLDKAKARASGRQNVEFVLGVTDDPKLPAGGVDIILMLDVYHHVDYPAKVLAALRKSLKPGGRLVVVEYYKRPEAMPGGRALEHIRLDEDDAIREIEENGFRSVSRRVHIPKVQWIASFEPK